MNNQYTEGLKRILDNNDIEEYTNDSLEKFTRKLFETKEIDIISSFDIELGNEEYLLLIKKENLTEEKFQKSLEKFTNSDLQSINNVLILEIFQDTQNLHKKDKNHISRLRKIAQEKLKNIKEDKKFSLRNVEYNSHLLVQIPDNKTINISINNRIHCLENSLEFSDNTNTKLKSFVFTAKLKDIISLYDNIGDRLFQNNLRIGLSEQLNVDSSIKSTLDQNPNEFWFLNNGISVYVPSENLMSLAKFDELLLTIKNSELLSVINGAQTISTVARTDYNKSDASVLLRIFTFKSDETKVSKEIQKKQIDKITVALNRQKPIKQEDIAFTFDFTYQMNNINPTNITSIYLFELIRRGESESINSRQFILSNFARIAKAYLGQKPGDARSKGINTLVKEDKNTPETFEDKDIFKNDEEKGYEDIFNDYYKPVNFSFELKKQLSDRFLQDIFIELIKNSNLTNTESIKVLIKYGRYFLISLIVYLLNHKSLDFSNWTYVNIVPGNDSKEHSFSEEHLKDLIKNIFNEFANFINTRNIDSNDFKKNELYIEFRNYIETIDMKVHL